MRSTSKVCQNIGSLAAYPFAPYLSDGIGRRPTIFLGAAIMCIATVVQTASQSVGMFIGARFLIGFGLTFAGSFRVHLIISWSLLIFVATQLTRRPCWSLSFHTLLTVPLLPPHTILFGIPVPSCKLFIVSVATMFIYLSSAAWTTYGTFKINSTWAWRVPSALQGLPSVIQIFLIWFCPESPRWLVSKGKDAQALKTLAYYHADGNE